MFPINLLLPRAARLYADRLAVWDADVRYDFAELLARTRRLAGALAARGVGRGDRVAILDVNSHRYLEAYYACAHAGAVLVPINSRLSAPELEYVLNDSGAKAMLVAAPYFDAFEAARPKLESVEVVLGYGGTPPPKTLDYETTLAAAQPMGPPVAVGSDDIAQIYYTSGTTGEPKGVCLTFGNMLASAVDSIVGLGLTYEDRWLHAAPMFHLVDAWSIWSFPMMGAPQICLAFEAERYLKTVHAARPTATGLPPTLINMVANHPNFDLYDLSSIRLVMYGGSPTPLGVLKAAMRNIPTVYVQAYGITETSGITTLMHPEDFCVEGPPEKVAITASAGRPVPNIDLCIVDDAGRELDAGVPGEVVVSGPRVMREYWNRPDKTEEVLRDGRYHTGDIGYLDEQGRLYVVDRKKDMIITGGENVYPAEVENVLSTHPAVLEAAVIGVPDEQWGEAVKAIVVPREGTAPAPEEIIAHCRGQIANYKVPKSVDIRREPLPKTGPGKIAKRLLRDPYWTGRDSKI
jgi:long-chain acyl-CoA synthetase